MFVQELVLRFYKNKLYILCFIISMLWNTFDKEKQGYDKLKQNCKTSSKPFDTFMEKLKHRYFLPALF